MREKVTVLFWLALMLLFPAVAGAQNYLRCERLEGTNTVKISYDQSGNGELCGPIYADENIEIVQSTTECPTNLLRTSIEVEKTVNTETGKTTEQTTTTTTTTTKQVSCFANLEKSDKNITLSANLKEGTTSSKLNVHTLNINTTRPNTQPTEKEISEFLENCKHESKPNEGDIGHIENQFSNTCFFISESNNIWSWDTTDPPTIKLPKNEPKLTCKDLIITKSNINKSNKDKFINSRILHPNSPIKISTLNCSKDKKFSLLINRGTYQGVPTIKTLGENNLIAEGTAQHISTSDQVLIPPRESGPLTITVEEMAQQNTANKIKDSTFYFVEDKYKSFISIGTSISWINNNFEYTIKKDADNKDVISSNQNNTISELTASYTLLLSEERGFNDLYSNLFSFGISTTLGITNISSDLKNLTPLNSLGIGAAFVLGNNLSINLGFSLQKIQTLDNDFKVGQPVNTNDIKNYTNNRFVITPQITVNLTPDIFKIIKSTTN